MKVIELFSGTECLSNEFRKRGHECWTVDWDEQFPSSLHKDIYELTIDDIPEEFRHADVVWLGTDCTTYSIAAISKHRKKNPITGNLDPVSDKAKRADATNLHCKELIKQINPKIQIWENPMGGFRKMTFNKDLVLNTTTYCQYGFPYRKQTDFLSNIELPLRKPCKNGALCHMPAPRGSQNSINGWKSKKIKSMYPPELCKHIVDICEAYIEGGDK